MKLINLLFLLHLLNVPLVGLSQSKNISVFAADNKTTNSHLRKYCERIYLFSELKRVEEFNLIHYNNTEIIDTEWNDGKKKLIKYTRNELPCEFNLLSSVIGKIDNIPSNHKIFLLAKNDVLLKDEIEGAKRINIESKTEPEITEILSKILSENKKEDVDIFIIHSGYNFELPKFEFKEDKINTSGIFFIDYVASSQVEKLIIKTDGKELKFGQEKLEIKVDKDQEISGYFIDGRGCKSNEDYLDIDFETKCDCGIDYGIPELLYEYTGNLVPRGARKAQWDFQITPSGGSGGFFYVLAIKNVCTEQLLLEFFNSRNEKFYFETKNISKLKEDMVKMGMSESSDYLIVKVSMINQVELIDNPREFFTVRVTPILKNNMECPSRSFLSKKIKFSRCEDE
jgi:hypothetical protein